MSKVSRQRWMVVVLVALGATSTCVVADDLYSSQPLVQAQFDKLIPTSYPTATATFDRLHSTIWPLVDPGVATVPITENLIHPLDYPLVTTTGGFGELVKIRPMHGFVQMHQPKSDAQLPLLVGKTK